MRDSEAAEFYSRRTKEENALREMLFMQHSHNGSNACLYGDDGEMQCGVCLCDFVRDSTEVLKQKIYVHKMRELACTGTFVTTLLEDGRVSVRRIPIEDYVKEPQDAKNL